MVPSISSTITNGLSAIVYNTPRKEIVRRAKLGTTFSLRNVVTVAMSVVLVSSVMTVILVYLTTYDLGTIEFMVVVLCLICIILMLTLPMRWTAKEEYFSNYLINKDPTLEDIIDKHVIIAEEEATFPFITCEEEACAKRSLRGWKLIDTKAYKRLFSLPSEIGSRIIPPLRRLVKNGTTDEQNSSSELENVDSNKYVEEEDVYVGSHQNVVEYDGFNNPSNNMKFVLDEQRFKNMEVEYQYIDEMLSLLRDADKDMYKLVMRKYVNLPIEEETAQDEQTNSDPDTLVDTSE